MCFQSGLGDQYREGALGPNVAADLRLDATQYVARMVGGQDFIAYIREPSVLVSNNFYAPATDEAIKNALLKNRYDVIFNWSEARAASLLDVH